MPPLNFELGDYPAITLRDAEYSPVYVTGGSAVVEVAAMLVSR